MVDLLIDQVEFCDVLVLNKTDLIDQAQLERPIAILSRLNPRAKIEFTEFGLVSLDRLLNTGLFDFEAAAANWMLPCCLRRPVAVGQ